MMSKDRLPPGQIITQRFPVLHYGNVPHYDSLDDWDLRISGAVEEDVRFTYDEITQMPATQLVTDIHCVTRWSKYDTVWEGVRFADLMDHVRPLEDAAYVIAIAEQGYTANLPWEQAMAENVLLAWKYDDKPLTPEHGWPLRLIVPDLYFWKSAKWLRGFELSVEDQPGFWEQAGYHNLGDPWKEQRYAR